MEKSGKKKPIEKKYDVIIGNPPYGSRGGLMKGLGEEGKIGKQEEYFIKRGVDLLEDGGVLSFIVPSSFLSTTRSYAKEQIASSGGELIAAYRLPEGVFEDTTIGTDIIVIRKSGNGEASSFVNDSYFSENPSNILGEIRTRKNKFGKEEQYVYGDKKETLEMLKKIGVENREEAEMRKDYYENYLPKQMEESKQGQYSDNLANVFNQIMAKYDKTKSQEALDKYDRIELNAKENKLFRQFTDEANAHILSMSEDGVLVMSVQDLFEEMKDFARKGGVVQNIEHAPVARGKRKPSIKPEMVVKSTDEARDEYMESDFIEFKKSDEVSFERFRENKARERMIKKEEKIVPEKVVEKNKVEVRKNKKKPEVVQDVG